MKIALLPNVEKEGALDCAQNINRILREAGHSVYIHKKQAGYFDNVNLCEHHFELAEFCDVFVTVGGDGTIIHAAKHAAAFNKPILGVNMGRVGYLAGIEKEDIEHIPGIIAGNCLSEERRMLKVEVNGKPLPYLALNEGVISGELTKIMDFVVSVDGEGKYEHRCDALIVATPTGSTAYSLAAGGPIVDPKLNCMIFTPVCPFSLYDRSVIYGEGTSLEIRLRCDYHGKVYLTVDGNAPVQLKDTDVIRFSIAERRVKLLKYDRKSFYDVVNRKLVNNNK